MNITELKCQLRRIRGMHEGQIDISIVGLQRQAQGTTGLYEEVVGILLDLEVTELKHCKTCFV